MLHHLRSESDFVNNCVYTKALPELIRKKIASQLRVIGLSTMHSTFASTYRPIHIFVSFDEIKTPYIELYDGAHFRIVIPLETVLAAMCLGYFAAETLVTLLDHKRLGKFENRSLLNDDLEIRLARMHASFMRGDSNIPIDLKFLLYQQSIQDLLARLQQLLERLKRNPYVSSNVYRERLSDLFSTLITAYVCQHEDTHVRQRHINLPALQRLKERDPNLYGTVRLGFELMADAEAMVAINTAIPLYLSTLFPESASQEWSWLREFDLLNKPGTRMSVLVTLGAVAKLIDLIQLTWHVSNATGELARHGRKWARTVLAKQHLWGFDLSKEREFDHGYSTVESALIYWLLTDRQWQDVKFSALPPLADISRGILEFALPPYEATSGAIEKAQQFLEDNNSIEWIQKLHGKRFDQLVWR